MITDERTTSYINSLDRGNSVFLNTLEMEAQRDGVPIIRREAQALLRVLLSMHRPLRILEVGTAVGFSALFMEEYAPEEDRKSVV